jgi:EAL domain-containing protein (putative c-di-GMP-specific phosphodiesterase class I)
VAEETGLIIPIGEWVLSKACRQMREWQIRYPISPPLTISVNLSSKQFTHPDLIMQIERILVGTGLEAHSLRLEITEGVIMENTVFSTDILKKLRALGVEVQMDDFGTGYSSLGVLHQFPLDTLKVDRTFISQMDTGEEKIAFVRTIVNLAHDLGMDVIAEGVETAEQVDQLKALRCKYAQGNYFSKSVDNEAAERLMRETDTKKT